MIEIQYRGGSRGVHGLFASNRPLTSLDKLLFKNLRQNKISVLPHNHLPQDFIARHSLSLIFTVKSLKTMSPDMQ